ncbi:hypothetical protein KI387_022203, partial [Taxus chinensis]
MDPPRINQEPNYESCLEYWSDGPTLPKKIFDTEGTDRTVGYRRGRWQALCTETIDLAMRIAPRFQSHCPQTGCMYYHPPHHHNSNPKSKASCTAPVHIETSWLCKCEAHIEAGYHYLELLISSNSHPAAITGTY